MENNIITFVNYIIEGMVAYLYFRSFYNSKRSKRVEIIWIIVAYIILFTLFGMKIFWFNIFSFFLANFLLCYYLYSNAISSSIFHALILTGTMTVTEIIIELISMRLLGGLLAFTQYIISYVIVSIGSRIFYFFVIRIVISFFAPKKESIETKSSFTVLLSIIPLMSVWLTIVIAVVCINSHIDSIMGGMLLASMGLVLGMNFVVFWAYDSNQKFM